MKKIRRISAFALIFVMALTVTASAVAKKTKTKDQKVVVIDAGHQSRANTAKEPIGPGASATKYKVTGGTTGVATHVPEYKLNLAMAKKLKKELKKRGYKVIMVREKNNVNLSNSQRAKIANKAKADAFIRIHANAGGSSQKGALTIAPTKNNRYMSAKNRKASQKFSKKMLKEFCKATGAKSNGIMYTDTMSGINWSQVPVTIVEMGFMTNAAEDRKMNTDAYREKMAQGMANGIDAFLK